MCDPVSAMYAVGGLLTYSNSRRTANAIEETAENNAQLIDQRISDTVLAGERRMQLNNQRVADAKGQQRVSIAGGGIVADQGSAVDALLDTAAEGAADAMMIRIDTENQIFGLQTQQQSVLSQAEIDASNLEAEGVSGLLTSGAQAGKSFRPGNGRVPPNQRPRRGGHSSGVSRPLF